MRIAPIIHDAERLAKLSRAFSFWAPAGTAVFGPLLLNQEYKQKGRPDAERKMLVFQEAASQGVNLLVHWTSFIFGSKLARKLINKRYPGISGAALEAAVTIAANVGSFLGMSLLRPIVSAKLLNRFMNSQDSKADAPAAPPEAAQAQTRAARPEVVAPIRRNISPPMSFASQPHLPQAAVPISMRPPALYPASMPASPFMQATPANRFHGFQP